MVVSAVSSPLADRKTPFETYALGHTKVVSIKLSAACLRTPLGVHGRKATLTERVLGLRIDSLQNFIRSNFTHVPPDRIERFKDPTRRIVITGIEADSPIIGLTKLSLGDSLISVNDFVVTLDTLEDVLAALVERRIEVLKIGLQPINAHLLLSDLVSAEPNLACRPNRIVSLMKGDRLQSIYQAIAPFLTGVLYLPENSKPGDGQPLVPTYRHPGTNEQVAGTSGAVMALHQWLTKNDFGFLKTVTFYDDDEETFFAESVLLSNGGILAIGIPCVSASPDDLVDMCDTLFRYLCFAYGSLEDAFSRKNLADTADLDHVFTILLYHTLCSNAFYADIDIDPRPLSTSTFCKQSEPCWLVLPDNVKLSVEECLNELESASFSPLETLQSRRLYTILWSALYYKDNLLASHMPSEDLLDVHTLLSVTGYHFITSGGALEDMLIWHEVFPSRLSQLVNEESYFGYSEPPDARYFMLAVAQKNFLLVTMLEAGGCACRAVGKPGPDAFHVAQVTTGLDRLENINLAQICENRLRQSGSGGLLLRSADVVNEQTMRARLAAASSKSVRKRSGLASSGALSPKKESRAAKLSMSLKAFLTGTGSNRVPRSPSLHVIGAPAFPSALSGNFRNELRRGSESDLRHLDQVEPEMGDEPPRNPLARLFSLVGSTLGRNKAVESPDARLGAGGPHSAAGGGPASKAAMDAGKAFSAVGSYISTGTGETSTMQVTMPPLMAGGEGDGDTKGLSLFDMSDLKQSASVTQSNVVPVAVSAGPIFQYSLVDFDQSIHLRHPPGQPARQGPLHAKIEEIFAHELPIIRRDLERSLGSLEPSIPAKVPHHQRDPPNPHNVTGDGSATSGSMPQKTARHGEDEFDDDGVIPILEEAFSYELQTCPPVFDENMDHLHDPHPFHFWVVGRSLQEPKQQFLFVAHADFDRTSTLEQSKSTPPPQISPLELAYKATFGFHI